MISRRELYAMGEPLGESSTHEKPFGRVYGGGGGGGGTSTSSTQATIPDELKGAATALSNVATRVGSTGYTPYTGQGVADLNQMQQAAMGVTANRALGGDRTINAGSDFIQKSLAADPATATINPYAQQGNPYLDQMVQKAQDSVRSSFNTAAINSGSFGNSGLQQQFTQGLGDVATQMYGNAYNTQAQLGESQAARNDSMYQSGMGQKLNAAQLGLNYGNQAYQDASQLFNMGQQAQNNTQDKLDFNYQQYLNQQDYPLKQMQALTGVLGQNMGSTTTTTQSGGGK